MSPLFIAILGSEQDGIRDTKIIECENKEKAEEFAMAMFAKLYSPEYLARYNKVAVEETEHYPQ